MREPLPQKAESYLHRLLPQGEQALKSAADQANLLREANDLRSQLTRVFFSPFESPEAGLLAKEKTGQQIKEEVLNLLSSADNNGGNLTKDFIRTSRGLISKWQDSLFNCYDVSLLPATNAALESRFNCLQRGPRRISGRKKTGSLSFCVVVDVFFTQRPIYTSIDNRNSGRSLRVLVSR